MQEINELLNKEEVLEICYWYKGEGFGEIFSAKALSPFLNLETEKVDLILEDLCSSGTMIKLSQGQYKLTSIGMKKGGKLFIDSFQEMQQPGHYECLDGCCDGDDHSKCSHN